MPVTLTKKQIGYTVLALYIIGSLLYICYSQWNNFKINYGERAFQNGQSDAIAQLLQQAQDPACKPFSVYNQSQTVQLVNVACLQAASTDTPEAATDSTDTTE